MKIIFFGNERLASGVQSKCLTLQALIDAGHTVSAVVVNQKSSSGRKKRQLEVAALAEANAIPVIAFEDSQQIIKLVEECGATIGVLAAFGRIVSQEVIDSFKHGILNIHPSLLPNYRGSTPIESAILNGDSEASVSLMLLAKEMDAGPVYGSSSVDLTGGEGKQQLYELLSEIGAKMLIELLPSIVDGSVKPLEQDSTKATYCSTISKGDSTVDWSKSADAIERQVRAYLGWPGSKTNLFDRDIIITSAHALPIANPEAKIGVGQAIKDQKLIIVNCGQGALCIDRLKPAGKQDMDAAGFINGLAAA